MKLHKHADNTPTVLQINFDTVPVQSSLLLSESRNITGSSGCASVLHLHFLDRLLPFLRRVQRRAGQHVDVGALGVEQVALSRV